MYWLVIYCSLSFLESFRTFRDSLAAGTHWLLHPSTWDQFYQEHTGAEHVVLALEQSDLAVWLDWLKPCCWSTRLGTPQSFGRLRCWRCSSCVCLLPGYNRSCPCWTGFTFPGILAVPGLNGSFVVPHTWKWLLLPAFSTMAFACWFGTATASFLTWN